MARAAERPQSSRTTTFRRLLPAAKRSGVRMTAQQEAWEVYELVHGCLNDPNVIRVHPNPNWVRLQPLTIDDYKLAVVAFYDALEQVENLAFGLANKLEGKVPGP